jgi:hypothetical protein
MIAAADGNEILVRAAASWQHTSPIAGASLAAE